MASFRFLCLFLFIPSILFFAGCQSMPPSGHSSTKQSATQPIPRGIEYEWMAISDWYKKHASHVAIAKEGNADIVFLGDSITESWNWDAERNAVFSKYFSQYKTANFGIGGDETQHLLWRLKHSLKGNLDPKVVVILIGVNNLDRTYHTPKEITAGIKLIIQQARSNYPNAKILVNGIFPFKQLSTNESRSLVTQTNKHLASLAKSESVYFYDFGNIFLNDNNDIPSELMGDFLHPSHQGLELYAKKISPIINDWLDQKN